MPVPRRTAVLLSAALLISSSWVVYTRYVDLRAVDPVQGQPYRELSLRQYRETLAGTMSFPAQWRLLGFWLVRASERGLGVDPHAADFALKSLALAGSGLVLFAVTATQASTLGALLATTLFLLAHAVAYAPEGYAIYHTNDYLLVLGWFVAVSALQRGRWPLAAAVICVTALAKESIGLAVLLAALEAWRGRLSWPAAALCGLAFAVPTTIVRTIHAAPITDWAWWTINLEKNLPFYSSAPGALATAVRNDLKVLLFLHLGWIVAAWAWRRTTDPFVRSLGIVLIAYLSVGWAVFMFRELRHFLPVLVLVIPACVAAIERVTGATPSLTPRAPAAASDGPQRWRGPSSPDTPGA